MTATPREPTREEIDAMEMNPALLLKRFEDNNDEWASNEGPYIAAYKAELLRRLKERDALLAQAPKVWTAEEIKDAPEGWYFPGFGFEPHGWDCRTMAPLSRTKDLLSFYQNTGMRMMAWGPVMLPPPPEEKGG